MVNLHEIPNYVMILVVSGLIFGAGLLALGSFRTALDTDGLHNNTPYVAVSYAITGIGNFAGMMPVIGTILGVAAIILVVLGAFMWGMNRKAGNGR